MYVPIFLFCFAFVPLGVLSADVLRIHNFSEFISFMKSPYSASTVFLESDIDFSESPTTEFGPIAHFTGLFDGQGHTISNLDIRSYTQDTVGLFGSPYESTFRNFVFDSSCSVYTNYTGSDNVRISGIIAYFDPNGYYTSECVIDSVVNMADVTFDGELTDYLGNIFMGGIIGRIISSRSRNYDAYIKNCANYGSMIHSGICSGAYVGGIVGDTSPYISPSINVYIQNCINYGSVAIEGKTSYSYAGGIIGYGKYATFENCVNAGILSSVLGRNGNIAGNADTTKNITHCLWTSGTNSSEAYFSGTPSILVNTSFVEINSTIVNELNEYARDNKWSRWLLNENNARVSFKTLNGNKGFSLSSQLIILIDNGAWWNEFTGWYTDSSFNKLFDTSSSSSSSTTIKKDTTFYGRFDKIVILFDPNGGSNLSYSSKNVTYNGVYSSFPVATMQRYSLAGWYSESNGGVKKKTDSRVTSNHTLYAHWTEITEEVVIMFGTKDLTREKAEEIINHYTDEDFTIVKIVNKGDEIKVIVKFVDAEKAEEFIRNVDEYKREGDSIESVGPVGNYDDSFAPSVLPPLFLKLILGLFVL